MPPHPSQRVDERKRGRKRPLRVGRRPLLKLGRVPRFPELRLEPLDLGTQLHHRGPRRLPALPSDLDRIKPAGMERAQPVRRVRRPVLDLSSVVPSDDGREHEWEYGLVSSDLQFVAVRFSFNSWSLQGVSAESSPLPGFRADF